MSSMRNFLNNHGYLEVETPILQLFQVVQRQDLLLRTTIR